MLHGSKTWDVLAGDWASSHPFNFSSCNHSFPLRDECLSRESTYFRSQDRNCRTCLFMCSGKKGINIRSIDQLDETKVAFPFTIHPSYVSQWQWPSFYLYILSLSGSNHAYVILLPWKINKGGTLSSDTEATKTAVWWFPLCPVAYNYINPPW